MLLLKIVRQESPGCVHNRSPTLHLSHAASLEGLHVLARGPLMGVQCRKKGSGIFPMGVAIVSTWFKATLVTCSSCFIFSFSSFQFPNREWGRSIGLNKSFPTFCHFLMGGNKVFFFFFSWQNFILIWIKTKEK